MHQDLERAVEVSEFRIVDIEAYKDKDKSAAFVGAKSAAPAVYTIAESAARVV